MHNNNNNNNVEIKKKSERYAEEFSRMQLATRDSRIGRKKEIGKKRAKKGQRRRRIDELPRWAMVWYGT